MKTPEIRIVVATANAKSCFHVYIIILYMYTKWYFKILPNHLTARERLRIHYIRIC